MPKAEHEHFPAFTLDLNALKHHLVHDHGVTKEAVPEDDEVVKWHNRQHPEIVPQPSR